MKTAQTETEGAASQRRNLADDVVELVEAFTSWNDGKLLLRPNVVGPLLMALRKIGAGNFGEPDEGISGGFRSEQTGRLGEQLIWMQSGPVVTQLIAAVRQAARAGSEID